MKRETATQIRCAVYTRVSNDQGLERAFNSLHVQNDAARAYIRSQSNWGWIALPETYEDGGFTGGNTDRPALQRLLQDVCNGRVDVIVVYKIDRLTRSLSDFAHLVDLFDKHSVSFASVTQQFNTATSMGRLTLNVLLSFAQFERDIASERMRDNIAACKHKGVWVGGPIPIGYQTRNKKVTINRSKADNVRTMFKKYLELGSLSLLMAYLARRRILTRPIVLKTGKVLGRAPFTTSKLGYVLRNRFYVGEIKFKGEILKGPQEPIIDRKLFNAVQIRMDKQRMGPNKKLPPSPLA